MRRGMFLYGNQFSRIVGRAGLGPVLMMCSLLLMGLSAKGIAGEGEQERFEFFEKKIRPILVEHCLDCHSEAKKVRGGLRLDSVEGWSAGGDTGIAVVPGKPEESLLIEAVKYQDDLKMPPKGKLSDTAIADLEEWIKRGAEDPRHENESAEKEKSGPSRDYWSYQPMKKVSGVGEPGWIDRLIGEGLAARGLRPLPQADREVLVRRLYFDLWGMPPTVEQIDEFVNDSSDDAWERLVDRLLASRHFGERWGRHWLDVVRFGESITLRGTIFPNAWRYRDYIIEAFHEDRPYDQLLREHLAGDLLAEGMGAGDLEARKQAIIGATFLQLGNTNLEEQDKQQLEMDFIDEQLDVMGKAFLGQTMGCARCHDHKFDPITTKDYYALAAIFKSVQTLEHANISKWIELKLPLEPGVEEKFVKQEHELAAVDTRMKTIKEELKKVDPKSFKRVVVASELPGIVVDDSAAKKVGDWMDSTFALPYVGAGYIHDQNRNKGEMTLTFQPTLPIDGTYEVRLAYTSGTNRSTKTPVTVFSAEGEKTIPVNQKVMPPIEELFLSLGTYRFEKAGQCFVIVTNEGTDGHVIADAIQFLPVGETAVALAKPKESSEEKPKEKTPEVAQLETELKELEKHLKEMKGQSEPRPTAMGVREVETLKEIPIHIRGSVHLLGDKVERGVPAVFESLQAPVFPENQSGRLQLAEWLANPEHPLTSRVMVNRIWHWLFGAGIVQSVDNFGTSGEMPTHPELLDGLAARFVSNGWSVKKLVREIVLSEAYRRSSGVDNENEKLDGINKGLWRANRRRLDGECLRDAMLLCGGNLNLTPYGPGFDASLVSDYEFQPQGTRRSVYVPVFRNRLPEIPEAFDLADPSLVTGARATSTIVPQALMMMNHPFIRKQAEETAKRLLSEVPDETERIERACRMILGRRPLEKEAEAMSSFLKDDQESGKNESGTMDELQAWTLLVQGLFASADFRYLD